MTSYNPNEDPKKKLDRDQLNEIDPYEQARIFKKDYDETRSEKAPEISGWEKFTTGVASGWNKFKSVFSSSTEEQSQKNEEQEKDKPQIILSENHEPTFAKSEDSESTFSKMVKWGKSLFSSSEKQEKTKEQNIPAVVSEDENEQSEEEKEPAKKASYRGRIGFLQAFYRAYEFPATVSFHNFDQLSKVGANFLAFGPLWPFLKLGNGLDYLVGKAAGIDISFDEGGYEENDSNYETTSKSPSANKNPTVNSINLVFKIGSDTYTMPVAITDGEYQDLTDPDKGIASLFNQEKEYDASSPLYDIAGDKINQLISENEGSSVQFLGVGVETTAIFKKGAPKTATVLATGGTLDEPTFAAKDVKKAFGLDKDKNKLDNFVAIASEKRSMKSPYSNSKKAWKVDNYGDQLRDFFYEGNMFHKAPLPGKVWPFSGQLYGSWKKEPFTNVFRTIGLVTALPLSYLYRGVALVISTAATTATMLATLVPSFIAGIGFGIFGTENKGKLLPAKDMDVNEIFYKKATGSALAPENYDALSPEHIEKLEHLISITEKEGEAFSMGSFGTGNTYYNEEFKWNSTITSGSKLSKEKTDNSELYNEASKEVRKKKFDNELVIKSRANKAVKLNTVAGNVDEEETDEEVEDKLDSSSEQGTGYSGPYKVTTEPKQLPWQHEKSITFDEDEDEEPSLIKKTNSSQSQSFAPQHEASKNIGTGSFLRKDFNKEQQDPQVLEARKFMSRFKV